MSLDPAELALVQEAISGSRKAFEELISLNERFVLNLARKFGPKEEIENISQETFISAFKAISNLKDALAFKGWLAAIAVRRCRDSWRAVYRRKAEVSFDTVREADFETKEVVNFTGAPSAESSMQGRMEVEAVLNQLSADDRMVMTLLYLEDKSVKEVSQLLGITQVNVKVRSHRIKKRLLKISQMQNDPARSV